ncbi:MAG: hypothetical protein Kow00117_11780 [Phototrophicales bacterium]
MRIMGYNIRKGGYHRHQLIADVITYHQPDVVIFEEAGFSRAVENIARLARYPHYAWHPGYSVAFMSHMPAAYQWHHFRWMRSPVLEILPKDTPLRIYGVHLFANLSALMEMLRVREIHHLIQLVRPYRHQPHVLIGDFNAIAPNDKIDLASYPRWLRWIIYANGGDAKRDALINLQMAGYADAFRQLHPDDNGWSLPTPIPNSRLDYAFVPQEQLQQVHDCRILREPEAANVASDHFPVMIELA